MIRVVPIAAASALVLAIVGGTASGASAMLQIGGLPGGGTGAQPGATLFPLDQAPAGVAAPERKVHAYFLGDSWSAGLHADPARTLDQVAAAELGWSAQVDAISGTGYLNGDDAQTDYASRAANVPADATADVVVVQGGSNDIDEPLDQLPDAIDATVRNFQSRFPDARIVLLGPGPDPFPASATEGTVDRMLGVEAKKLGVDHISMLDEEWITAANVNQMIDPGNIHPTVAGQRYLGERLAADLAALGLQPND